MTILSKDEKVKEELHRVLGEGQGVGAYNRNRFLLTYRSGGGGGNVPKHFKLGL